jgi:hypothetical protein
MASTSDHAHQEQSAQRKISACETCTRAGAATAIVVGILGALKWAIGRSTYSTVLPGLASMGPGIALALALVGVGARVSYR